MGEEIKISAMKETPKWSGKETEQRSQPRCVVFSDGVHGGDEMKTSTEQFEQRSLRLPFSIKISVI